MFAFEKDGVTAKSYMGDGDHSMYTDENMAKRKAIRNDETIKGWLTTFYHTFFASRDAPVGDDLPRDDVLKCVV
jgi:hypothetical protein